MHDVTERLRRISLGRASDCNERPASPACHASCVDPRREPGVSVLAHPTTRALAEKEGVVVASISVGGSGTRVAIEGAVYTVSARQLESSRWTPPRPRAPPWSS